MARVRSPKGGLTPFDHQPPLWEAFNRYYGTLWSDGVVDDPTPMKTAYDPGNPAANPDGYVTLPNVDHDTAQSLTEKAHQVCPYSNATRGNVDVKLVVTDD